MDNRLILVSTFFILMFAVYTPGFANQTMDLTDVSLVLKWRHQFQFAGYYAAKEKGFFDEEGLSVNIIEGKNIDAFDYVENGRADFGISGSGLVVERIKGRSFIALAAVFQTTPYVWMVLKDSGIESPRDFIGKTLMHQHGSVDGAELIAIFIKENIPLNKINLKETSYDINDLINRKTDGYTSYISNEPFVLIERGLEYSLIKPPDYGLDFYGDVIFTSENMLKQNPEVVRSFRSACLKGWEYAFNNKEEIVDLIVRKYNTQNKSRKHLEYEAQELEKLSLYKQVQLGQMSTRRWLHIAETFKELEIIKSRIDLDGFLYDADNAADQKLSKYMMFAALILVLAGAFFLVKYRFR